MGELKCVRGFVLILVGFFCMNLFVRVWCLVYCLCLGVVEVVDVVVMNIRLVMS